MTLVSAPIFTLHGSLSVEPCPLTPAARAPKEMRGGALSAGTV